MSAVHSAREYTKPTVTAHMFRGDTTKNVTNWDFRDFSETFFYYRV